MLEEKKHRKLWRQTYGKAQEREPTNPKSHSTESSVLSAPFEPMLPQEALHSRALPTLMRALHSFSRAFIPQFGSSSPLPLEPTR